MLEIFERISCLWNIYSISLNLNHLFPDIV